MDRGRVLGNYFLAFILGPDHSFLHARNKGQRALYSTSMDERSGESSRLGARLWSTRPAASLLSILDPKVYNLKFRILTVVISGEPFISN